MIEVVWVHVRDYRNIGVVVQKGAVGFVSFNHKVLSRAKTGRGAVLLNHAAIDEAGVGTQSI